MTGSRVSVRPIDSPVMIVPASRTAASLDDADRIVSPGADARAHSVSSRSAEARRAHTVTSRRPRAASIATCERAWLPAPR